MQFVARNVAEENSILLLKLLRAKLQEKFHRVSDAKTRSDHCDRRTFYRAFVRALVVRGVISLFTGDLGLLMNLESKISIPLYSF